MKKVFVFMITSLILVFMGSCGRDLNKLNYRRASVAGGSVYIIQGNRQGQVTTNTTVEIPSEYKGVKRFRIASDAFINSINLKKVSLSKETIGIGSKAFYNSFLNKIEIPVDSNLISIGYNAFSYSNLEEIYLPDSLMSIDSKAFSYARLDKIYIPKSVVEMDDDIFIGNKGLKIYLEAESIPETWSNEWNSSNFEVFYNVTREEYNTK